MHQIAAELCKGNPLTKNRMADSGRAQQSGNRLAKERLNKDAVDEALLGLFSRAKLGSSWLLAVAADM